MKEATLIFVPLNSRNGLISLELGVIIDIFISDGEDFNCIMIRLKNEKIR